MLAFLENRFADTGEKYTLKRLMGRYGEVFPCELIQFREAMGQIDAAESASQLLSYSKLVEENPCVTVGQLAVNGKDAAAAGLRGEAIGKGLGRLLDAVMREEIPNNREVLLDLLRHEC